MLSTPKKTEQAPFSFHFAPEGRGRSPFVWLREGFALNPWLMVVGLLMLLALVAAGVGLIVDHQVITGAPAWAKPAKFAISLSIYCFTFIWLLTFVQRWKKLAALITALVSIAVMGEMSLIVLQVMRGMASHFNVATPFNSVVYSTMGGFAVVLWVGAFITGILLLFEHGIDRALLWSLRLGLVIAMAGMFVGVLMTLPTAAQLVAAHVSHTVLVRGAHSVGVADGGPGLPFLGWSTVGGDLRIAHFVGLHALQVLPFLGWLLSQRRFSLLPEGHRVALVWTASLGYFGLMLSLLWQALRGQSLIAPDALTWLTWGGVAGLTLLALAAIVIHARPRKMS